MLRGIVRHVAADSIMDEQSGVSFYLAKVEIEPGQLETLKSEVDLYPGMPAEVFIVTGARTFWQYFIDPITESFEKAFREE